MAVLIGAVLVSATAVGAQPSPGESAISEVAQRRIAEGGQRARAAAERRTAAARAASPDPRRLADVSDARALEAAVEAEPELFEPQPTKLLDPPAGHRLKRYVGDFAARLDVEGKQSDVLVESTLPLRVDNGHAFRRAGVAPTRTVDVTGDAVLEARLTRRIAEMGGSPLPTTRVRGAGRRASYLDVLP